MDTLQGKKIGEVMKTTKRSGFSRGLIASVILTGISLSGCTTVDPYTGETTVSKTTIGAGTGAIAGAAVGQAIGKNTTGTLIGAALGGVVGGVTGNYLDAQDAELRRALVNSGVQVVRDGNQIRLIMSGNITFKHDSYSIRPSFYRTLNSVALVLKKYPRTAVQIIGYASSVGEAMYNQQLSERRALSVADYLVAQGVKANRLSAMGRGARNLIASDATIQGQEQNRRVEIIIQDF